MLLYKKRSRQQQREFVELFSINKTTGEQEANLNGGDPDERVIEEERDLNKEEEDILKAFRENDKELEDIAQTIVEELKKVKLNAENIEAGIDKQKELLKGVQGRAEKTNANL